MAKAGLAFRSDFGDWTHPSVGWIPPAESLSTVLGYPLGREKEGGRGRCRGVGESDGIAKAMS